MSLLVGWSPISPFHSFPAQLLASALWHFLWQGALIGAVTGLAFWRIRAREVRLRSAVALLAITALAALPPATLLRMTAGPVVEAVLGLGHGGVSGTDQHLIEGATAANGQTQAASPSAGFARLDSWARAIRPWALSLWLLGVVVGAAVWLGSSLLVRRLRRSARPAAAEWVDSAREAARKVGWRADVPVLQSEKVSAPFVVGILRPCILVPAASDPDADTRVQVLAHEMAHLRRGDPWKNLLQTWAEILYFFHPSVWYVSRRLRVEREHCCDELAAAACGDALTYARALTSLEEGRRYPPAFALGSGVSLKGRIARLLETSARPALCSRRVQAVAVIAAGCLFLGAAAAPSTPKREQKGGAHPEEVFQRLIRAYDNRDLNLFKTCFTDDYTFDFRGMGGWPLNKELESADKLFHDPNVTGIELTIGLETSSTREVGPETWVIEGVSDQLAVHVIKDGKPDTYQASDKGDQTFTIRWDAEHGYRISHWRNGSPPSE